MVKIYACKIKDKYSTSEKTAGLLMLSLAERKRYARFKDERSANLYLFGKILTRKILGRLINYPPEKLAFKKNKFGCPALLRPKNTSLNFNLSHSGNFVVLAVGQKKLGIDVEIIRPIDASIFKNNFSKKELDLIKRKKTGLRNFYQIWTLKESFIKALGKGLSHPLSDISFLLGPKNQIKLEKQSNNRRWHFRLWQPGKNYQLALCSQEVPLPKKINFVDWQKLI